MGCREVAGGTDVEGSTRRWENDADGMRVALAARDEALHGAVEAHGGFMFNRQAAQAGCVLMRPVRPAR
jgi:class 3 adenylate cyclase